MPDASRRDAAILLGGLAGVALAVDLLRRIPHINTTTVALVLLLIVLGTATFARLRVAVLTSIVSMLAFNFFFMQPVGSFFVADPQNWVVLGVFVAVAVVASQLSASAQERARARLAETLLASMSHDMRTPLTAIRLAVENLRGLLSEDERDAQSRAAQMDRAAVAAGRKRPRHGLHRCRRRESRSPMGQRGRRHRRGLVTGRVAADGLHLSVTDQGPGLDPAEIERLFDRFYRGHAASASTHGTGMGLTIARGLVGAAGGSVWAESVAGAGARFSLSVPAPIRAATALE